VAESTAYMGMSARDAAVPDELLSMKQHTDAASGSRLDSLYTVSCRNAVWSSFETRNDEQR